MDAPSLVPLESFHTLIALCASVAWQSLLLIQCQLRDFLLSCCRGGTQTDAIGRLILGPMDAGGTGEGRCVWRRTRKDTNTHRFTQVQGSREEIKPLLLLV